MMKLRLENQRQAVCLMKPGTFNQAWLRLLTTGLALTWLTKGDVWFWNRETEH